MHSKSLNLDALFQMFSSFVNSLEVKFLFKLLDFLWSG